MVQFLFYIADLFNYQKMIFNRYILSLELVVMRLV
jgi:hypothetical protein